MNYRLPLNAEEHAAYLSMPRTRAGVIVSLFQVPRGELPEYEAAWRAWLSQRPKRLWPNWVQAWGAQRKPSDP
jgi:hypothetical protein